MGRSGSGGGGRSGGFSHSSGSGGFSRSGGSSRRSGASSSPRSGSPGFGGSNFRMPPPPRPHYGGGGIHVHNHYGPSYGRTYTRTVSRGVGNLISGIITLIVVVAILMAMFGMMGGVSKQTSTIQREKLLSPNAFDSSCIDDELGWVGSGSKMKKAMKQFWDETGVQPYIVLTYDDYTDGTSRGREQWASDYFDTYCDEQSFLYVYFEGHDSSQKGPDCVWYGASARKVMDDEACNIFLGYLDDYWVSWDADDTDGMFAQIYTKTASTIMRVSTTGMDVMKYVVIGVVVIGALVVVVIIMNKKRANEAARAAETERILNAGQNQQTFGSGGDDLSDLTDRYDNM